MKNKNKYRRILIIDDNHLIHGDFHKIFATQDQTRSALETEAQSLFGSDGTALNPVHFVVDSAYGGQEGVEKVRQAIESNHPYAMAFVDMRMPRGWDGLETTRELCQVDPDIQIVLCTAYSDYSWKEMLESIDSSDRMVVLKKPFDPIEALQLAYMLTEKWMLQLQAKRKTEDLEEKVAQRTGDLLKTNQVLQRRNEEIQYFYHTLSHELKTPLTSAMEFISIVTDGLAGPLNETQLEYLGVAAESCSHLAVYINDLFDAARLDTGKMSLRMEPKPLVGMIQKVLRTTESTAAQKNIHLYDDLDTDLGDVMIDESRFMQILNNLYNNALKFTPEGGSISIRACRHPERPEWAEISIADTGCGIMEDQIEHLFHRYYQVGQSGPEEKKGVGLGLYLVRQLVKLHGGEIRVESQIGQGCTFIFSVKIATPTDSGNTQPAGQESNPDGDQLDSLSPATTERMTL